MKTPCSRAFSRSGYARRNLVLFAAVFYASLAPASVAKEAKPKDAGLQQIRSYIADAWDTLTRSQTDCKVIVDPKLAAASVLYLPADFQMPGDVEEMQKRCKVQVKRLPQVIHGLG